MQIRPVALFTILCIWGCLGQTDDQPTITLYELPDFTGDSVTLTQENHDLGDFADRTDSICGKGLWFLYEHVDFDEKSDFVHTFASHNYTCENLDFTQIDLWFSMGKDCITDGVGSESVYLGGFVTDNCYQKIGYVKDVSSVRYAGAISVDEESLTMYKDYRFCGNSLVTLKDLEYLGDYNDDISSFAVLGNSSWTIYNDHDYLGDAVCLDPTFEDGFWYGLFDTDSLGFKDNEASSVEKGCHTFKKAKRLSP